MLHNVANNVGILTPLWGMLIVFLILGLLSVVIFLLGKVFESRKKRAVASPDGVSNNDGKGLKNASGFCGEGSLEEIAAVVAAINMYMMRDGVRSFKVKSCRVIEENVLIEIE